MILKSYKDRKIKNGRIIECIVVGCSKSTNTNGFCWEHYGQNRKENPEEQEGKDGDE